MLVLLLLSIIPRDAGVLRETVDVVEQNSFYDEHCRLVFEQNIYRVWSNKSEHHEVRGWRLLKTDSMRFIRDPDTGYYVAIWMDGEAMRCVYAKSVVPSWSMEDPELLDREFLPKEKRQELRSYPQRKKQ